MSNINTNSGIIPFRAGRQLTQEDIKKLQKPYVTTVQSSVSNPDTVEITQNKSKQKWYQKYKKHLLIAGATIVAVTAAILGKQKIDANKVKKAEAEAKRLEAEARQKAREAEEKARIESEEKLQEQRKAEAEARKKAKLEAEAKAKAEAEEKARIEAERAKEAERAAKELEKRKKIDEIRDNFNEKYSLANSSANSVYKVYKLSTQDFAKDFVDVLRQAENNGATEEELCELFKSVSNQNQLTDDGIQAILGGYKQYGNFAKFQIKHKLESRSRLLNDVDLFSKTVQKSEEETYSSYIEKLLNKSMSRQNITTTAQEKEYSKEIGRRLEYSNDIEINQNLTEEDLDVLRKWDNETFKNLSPDEAKKELEKIGRKWVYGYTGDYMDAGNIKEIEDLVLSKGLPRYDSTQGKADGAIKPVVRWMHIGDNFTIAPDGNVDKYIEETFKVGEEYVAPKLQSCSKNYSYAESSFNDAKTNMDVKLIIHPQGKKSQAVDIGYGQYGENEAIYPKGSKFTVIDKRLVEHVENGESTYRWIIEMQEKPPVGDVVKNAPNVKDSPSVHIQTPKAVSSPLVSEIKPFDTSQLYSESDKVALQELKEKYASMAKCVVEEKVVVNGGKEETMKRFAGTQSGSTVGSWAEGADGTLYYLKFGDSTQNATEYASAQLYRLAGLAVPEVDLLTSKNGETWVRSKIVAGLNPHVSRRKTLYEGFATDAWLANWDAIVSQNTQIKNGKAVKIDFGCSFDYRAMGGCKDFTPKVSELHTILQHNDLAYRFMKREDLIESLEHVNSVKSADIDAVKKLVEGRMNPKLFDTLKERQQYLGKILEVARVTPMEPSQTIFEYVRVLEQKVK